MARRHLCGTERSNPRNVKPMPGNPGPTGSLCRRERNPRHRNVETAGQRRADNMNRGCAAECRNAARDLERAGRHSPLDVHLRDVLPWTELEATRASGHDTQERATRTCGIEPEL